MEDVKYLTAEDILAVDDQEIIEVEIPEWKGVLRLRAMSADEAIKFQQSLNDGNAKRSSWVRILALCAVDADGNRLFSDAKMEQLRKKSTPVFMRLQKTLIKLNGFEKQAEDDSKNE